MPKNQRTVSPKLSNTTAACPKVALLVETSRGYGRGLLRGIVRYARLHGPWSFYVTPSDFEQALPEMILWGGTGIIARVETPEMAKAIRAANLPTVLVGANPIAISHVPELEQFSEVSSDSEGAARMAAEHLLERGLGNFAYVGIPDRKWSRLRGEAFCAAIQAAGYTPHVYIPPRSKKARTWEREQKSLAEWIGAQPKPLGLMACNDDRGRSVLEACRVAGAQVPEEVAVIGVDNDELICELANPPLSSVALNTIYGGYRAAHLLAQLMQHKIDSPQRLVVEATHVIVRHSTKTRAIEGREVLLALDYIQRNRDRNFTVSDVAEATGISRRNLEVKFRKATGRTMLAEIHIIRLEHAKRMLRETDLPIQEVAASSGYNSASYITQVFRKEIGMTPAKFRSRFRI